MSRINLIGNPSFKTDTTGWSTLGSGTSFVRSTTDGFFGSTCLEVTKPAIASAGVAWSSAATTNLLTNPSFQDATTTVTSRTNLTINSNFEATPQTLTSRTNLCANPSFEHATTPTAGWLGAGGTPATIAVSTAQKYVGNQSLLVTYAAGVGGTNNGAGYALSLPATTMYTYSAYVYTPTGSVLPQLSVQGTSFAVTSTNATLYDTWERLSVTFTTTTSQNYNFYVLNSATVTSGKTFYLDAVLIEQIGELKPYFDGNTATANEFNYAWTSTTNLSTSTEKYSAVPNYTFGGNASTVAKSSATSFVGTNSGLVTSTKVSSGKIGFYTLNHAVTAGTTYTSSIYVKDLTLGIKLRVQIDWYNGGTYVGSSIGTYTTISTGSWTRLSVTAAALKNGVNGHALADATFGSMVMYSETDAPYGKQFYTDAALFEASSVLKPYFDGSTSGTGTEFSYAWSGTADASTSIQQYSANSTWGSIGTLSAIASTAQYYIGTKSALATADGSGIFGMFNSGVAFAFTAVTVGVTYTSSIYVRDVNTAVSYYAGIEWRNSGGSSFSTINGTSKTVTSSGWTRVSVTATAPPGAVTAGLVFYATATPASGTQAYFDGAVFEASSTPTSYFDGSVTAIAPGTTYSASLYVKIPVGQEASSLRLYLYWYDFTGTQLSFATGALIPMVSDEGWVRLAVTAVAPTDAVIAQIRLYQPNAGTAGQKFLIDAAMLEASAYVNEYTDDFSQGQETTKVNNALRPVPYPHLTGMQLNADVNINGLILNTIDEDSIVWVCTGINGWWGQTQSDIQDLPRGLGDGSYDVVGRYTARQIELKGSILPPDASYIDAARNKLVKAIDLVRKKGWLLADESPVKGAQVRLSGQPTIDVVNARGRMDFSVGLRAPDPIKYHYDTTVDEGFTKATITSGGSATFNNIGNTNVCVLMTATGPFTANSVIKNTTTNQSIKMLSALSAAGLSLGTVSAVQRVTTGGVKYATVSIASNYQLAAGDTITIASVGNSFDGTFVISSVSFTSSTTVDVTYVYTGGAADYTYASASGTVTLTNKEFMVIDTYNRDVFLNNNTIGNRALLDTLIDWIVLQPGNNTITVTDAASLTTGTVEVKFRSGWIG
jgi:hypothetical protein